MVSLLLIRLRLFGNSHTIILLFRHFYIVAATILGARKGRFREIDGKNVAENFPGHSIALKTLGVLILWFG